MQANERTARVLLVFAGDDEALGVTEIARRLGLGKSTVHRALEGLVASGIVMLPCCCRVRRCASA